MPDPTIVAPPPTITQPSHPTPPDTSPGLDMVQAAFDRVLPEIKKTPSAPKSTQAPPAPVAAPEKPVTPPPEVKPPAPETPPSTTPEKKPDTSHAPSFLEEALKLSPSQPAAPDLEADIPEELPPEEKKSRIKSLRDEYKKLKQELTSIKSKPPSGDNGEVANLRQANKQMQEVLTRMGVETSAQFQQEIMAPLHGAWNEAVRIVRDAGGDPQGLVRAMSMNGKAQFEALDELFADMPESAKTEASQALTAYRRFEGARRQALANAPKTMETIRARENQRQLGEIQRAKADMSNMFDNALSKLRDEAKVEVFMRSSDPNSQWWNDQAENVVKQARELFLENTDMSKVAMACLLAPAADTYRKLFINSQKKVSELQKIIDDRLGREPNLSESGGKHSPSTTEQMSEDLKKPFDQVFLRKFHQLREGR